MDEVGNMVKLLGDTNHRAQNEDLLDESEESTSEPDEARWSVEGICGGECIVVRHWKLNSYRAERKYQSDGGLQESASESPSAGLVALDERQRDRGGHHSRC